MESGFDWLGPIMSPQRLRREKGMGTFYPDGHGYRVRGRLNGAFIKFRVRTLAEAALAIDRLGRGEDPRVAVDGAGRSVEGWLREYLAIRTDLKERTAVGYEQLAADHIIPALGTITLGRLETPQVIAMLDDMRRAGYSNSVLKNTRNVLSGALKKARARGFVTSNVASGITIGESGNNFLVPGFDHRMAAKVLDAVEGHQFYDFWALLLYSCMRVGEAQGLDWRYVHLAKGEVTLIQAETRERAAPGSGHKTRRAFGSLKNRKSRVVPLPDEARRLLWRRYSAMGRPKSGLVFPAKRDSDKPLSASWTLREFKLALTKAGLPTMTHHQLRHAGASLLLAAGWEIPVVSKLLGHRSPEITYRLYAWVIGQREKQAIETLTFFPHSKRGRRPKSGEVEEPPSGRALKGAGRVKSLPRGLQSHPLRRRGSAGSPDRLPRLLSDAPA